jgi:hypothetical protein
MTVEVDGLEPLKQRWRSRKLGLLLFKSLIVSVMGVRFWGLLKYGGCFLGSVAIEVDGFEPLQHGRRSSELGVFLGFLLSVAAKGVAPISFPPPPHFFFNIFLFLFFFFFKLMIKWSKRRRFEAQNGVVLEPKTT